MSSDEERYISAFGESLRNMRTNKLKKSLRLFAYETDVPRSTLCRLENGQCQATIVTLKKIANGFNYTIDEFLKEIEKNIPDNIKNFDI